MRDMGEIDPILLRGASLTFYVVQGSELRPTLPRPGAENGKEKETPPPLRPSSDPSDPGRGVPGSQAGDIGTERQCCGARIWAFHSGASPSKRANRGLRDEGG
jgi:hypothetical protein